MSSVLVVFVCLAVVGERGGGVVCHPVGVVGVIEMRCLRESVSGSMPVSVIVTERELTHSLPTGPHDCDVLGKALHSHLPLVYGGLLDLFTVSCI